MLKAIALCCLLLQAHAACAPGAGACDTMDESALVQKDLALAQKRLQEPTEVDKQSAAKHISEGLSLHYLLQGAHAKLDMAKRLDKQFAPILKDLPAAIDTYGNGAHTKEDFDKFRDDLTSIMEKAVKFATEETEAAEADLAKTKEEMTSALDDMENQDKFAELISKYAIESQVNTQAQFLSKLVKSEQETVRTALARNQEHSPDGFNPKVFAKTNTALRIVHNEMKSNIGALFMINIKKVKEVEAESTKFTSHSVESLNGGIQQVVAMAKHEARTALAQKILQSWAPVEGKIWAAVGAFASGKRSPQDFKTLRASLEQAFEEIDSSIKTPFTADTEKEKQLKSSLLATMDNLADEEDIATKVVEYSTTWGLQRLESDLHLPVSMQTKTVKDALDTFEDETKDGYKDEAFGKVYKSVIEMVVSVKSDLAKWSNIETAKMEELQPGTIKLHSFMKQ